MSVQEGQAKEVEPQLCALTFSGYYDRSSGFTGSSIIDMNSGQFVGTIEDELGTADILGEKSDSQLHFVKLYRERKINSYPINYEFERREEAEWEGQYSYGPIRGHSIMNVIIAPLGESRTFPENYKQRYDEVSKLIADRKKEFKEGRLEDSEDGYYEPGNPRTVGLPSKPITYEDLQSFFERYSSPEAIRKLSEGRDEGIKAITAVIKRDSLLSAFPDLLDAIDFLGEVAPKFIQEVKGDSGIPESQEALFPGLEKPEKISVLAEFGKDKSTFAIKLLSSLLLSRDGVAEGGQETQYIFLRGRVKEVSYEYIGEAIMKLIRKEFSDDKDPRVRAFFGWVGRHLMKKVHPSTEFSLHRHYRMVEEDRQVILEGIKKFKEAFEKGVDGEFTLENCYKFFKELRDIEFWSLPNILTAETPLQWRVQNGLNDFYGYDDLTRFLPQEGEEFSFDTENNFFHFVRNWEKPEDEKGWSYRKYYTERFPEVFGDLPAEGPVDEKTLMQKWFQMLNTIIAEGIERVEQDARDFVVTYFRFIENRSQAEGYAFAQKHIEEILANLPEVVRLSEDEIKKRFMQGMPPIFYDDNDDGNNRADEWKDRPKDHWKWVYKSRIKGKAPDLAELDEIDD